MVTVEIRRQIASLARRPHRREARFSRHRPTRWHPQTIKDPKTGVGFTPEGAWEFILREIEGGHPMEVVELRRPPGARGYVMKIQLEANRPRLYVKVELGRRRLYGRSFHYSDS